MATIIILSILLCATCACVIVFYKKNDRTSAELSSAQAENARLAERLVLMEQSRAELEEAHRQQEEARRADRQQDEERFKALANQVLLDNSRALTENHRASLTDLLTPFRTDFEKLRTSVAEQYTAEARERFSLAERIRELVELNRTIGGETRRLTDAIKGNSRMQGDWGEMILENILDRSGLQRGREYEVQAVTTTDEGMRLRPDVIVKLPGKRCIVIDSKVSVQAYMAMLEADTPEEAQNLGRAHVVSVKKHIAELRNKNYQDLVGSDSKVDFVMMFIPHEGAYLSAMNIEPNLWQTAYDSRVIIISPTHLMSAVKLVEQMWQQENRSANAERIAVEAGKMLDKFRGFLDEMDKMDRAIRTARDSWDSAFGKLTSGPGNLISKAEKLRQMGVKAAKQLPERYSSLSEAASEEEA